MKRYPSHHSQGTTAPAPIKHLESPVQSANPATDAVTLDNRLVGKCVGCGLLDITTRTTAYFLNDKPRLAGQPVIDCSRRELCDRIEKYLSEVRK